MKNKTQMMIDPPSGWRYGFPKPYDENKDGDLRAFLKSNGYPEKNIDFALENCRMFYEEIEAIKTMKTKNKSIDPNYLKVGKFKKKAVYDAKVDMSDQMENTFESLGREHITKEQYINIGFNYALIKGLGEAKKVKSKKK
jgi:hypothetical protein